MLERYEARSLWPRFAKGVAIELVAARHLFRREPRTKFVIFAQGRTGSTLLTTSLDTHSRIRCQGEILDRPKLFPLQFLNARARGGRHECFGFHVKCYQLTTWQRVADLASFMRMLDRTGWRIIYLWRENALQHVLSNAFVEAAGGQYHFHKDNPNRKPVQLVLPTVDLIERIEERLNYRKMERAALDGLNVVELKYERDLVETDDKIRTFRRIQEFIEVPFEELRVKLEKSVTRSLRDVLKNYDEVVDLLRLSPYADFLH